MKAVNRSVPSEYQDKYRDEKFNFPPEDVPAKEKEKLWWCKMFPQAIWNHYCRGNTQLPYAALGENQEDYATIRLYAEGNQPVEKYKTQIGHENAQHEPDKAEAGRFSYNTGISWANQSIIPKYRRATIQNLMDMDGDLSPFGVDENSMKMRQRIKNEIWLKSQNKFYAEINKQLEVKETEELPFYPADKKELELYAMTSLELAHEVNMKKVVDRCFALNRWSDFIKKKLYEDLHDLGLAITNEYLDTRSKKPKVEYIDPEYAIFPSSMDNTYDDIGFFAHVVFMPVNLVRARLKAEGKYEGEEKFFESITGYLNFTGGGHGAARLLQTSQPDTHGQFPYDFMKLPVLHSEYKTHNTDTIIAKKFADAPGEYEDIKTDPKYNRNDEKVRTVAKNTYEMWYKCDWIIGTEIFFNHGKKDWIKRRYDGKTYPSYTIFRIGNNSFGNQMIAIEDELEMITKRMQIAWLNAHPQGFALFWDALTELSYGTEKIQPLEVLQLLMDKGVLMLNSKVFSDLGMNNIANAIHKLEGGVGAILNEYVLAWGNTHGKMNQLIGISDTLTGDQPIPGQLVKTTELSQRQSIKAIKHLYDAYGFIKKSSYQKVIYDVQSLAQFDPDGFEEVFSEFSTNTVQKIKIGLQDGGYHYELQVEEEATDQQRQQMIQDANLAAQKGVISFTDSQLIAEYVNRGKTRFARLIMEYRTAQNQKMAQQMNMQNIEANAKAQEASLAKKGEMDAANIEKETQGEIQVQRVMGEIKAMLLKLENSLQPKSAEGEEEEGDKKKTVKKKAA